ncbi:hypothetical protein [Williamsia deligens]|uniref:Uncharacterized protein n=1 Tax=Williamsia deligens TaxID=321325 RepID=A0ABW3GBE6_9NOCA|nr:hypothetical protein [Williamsia deligens]MCP2195999.1 hypothetical protein [Williamsia deligens]
MVDNGISPTGSASTTRVVDVSSVADTSILTNLVAISTNIFSGRVESALGAKALGALPETQFRVTAAVSLKGTVPSSLTLNQQGGITDGAYTSINGDRPLRIGQWYLFYTRYLDSLNWYTVVSEDGHPAITETEADDSESTPLSTTAAAVRSNPQNQFVVPSPNSTPTLTFPPPPPPGREYPPPSSPPQPRAS